MKYLKRILFLFSVTAVFSGCLLTLHPIYTEKDVIYDADLIGNYAITEGEEPEDDTMHIEPLSATKMPIPKGLEQIRNKGYLITQKGKLGGIYIAYLVRLNNNNYYFDFYNIGGPINDQTPINSFFKSMLVPMHSVYKLQKLPQKGLVFHQFSQSFMQDLISKRQLRIKHEKVGEYYMVTASTAELQQYIAKYGNRKDAYEEKPATYLKY
jgi:hypothetical protein